MSTSAAATFTRQPARSARLAPSVYLIAGVAVALQLATSGRYGYFRDTLYYIACSHHPAWGYVDQPPLIVGLFWLARHTIGTSLFALAAVAAAAEAGLAILTAAVAREMGGGRFAQMLSALACACVPVYLVEGHQLSMNSFEPLLWTACGFVLLRLINAGDERLWLWFGVLAGLGMENKYSIGVFAVGVVAGVLLTRERRALAQKWIWLGGLIALLIFLPNLVWNVQHHWPFIELMRNIRASGRNVVLGPAAYWVAQAVMVSPVNLLLWAPGLAWLLLGREGKYRPLGWTFLVTAGIFMALRGKDYYTAPIYPMLLAAGAAAWEGIAAARRPWLRRALPAALLVATAPLLPVVIPLLPLPTYLAYQRRFHLRAKPSEKSHAASPLPQYYSDELGWRQMTAETARVYFALPPAVRAKTAIFGENYGEAAAIDFFGPRYGLPAAISAHQSYYLWGPRGYSGESMIVLWGSRADLLRYYQNVTQVGEKSRPYALERGPIWLCENPRGHWTLSQIWPRIKRWD